MTVAMILIFAVAILLIIVAVINRKYSLRYRVTCKLFGTPRERNQKHCYDYPAENNGWKKYGTSPVYGNKTTGTVFDPYVYVEGDDFLMCASERLSGSLILLRSVDGKEWRKVSVMLSGVSGSWDGIVNRGCVLRHNGTYMLWYTGQSNNNSAIGLALSVDGICYKRAQSQPVLSPSLSFEGEAVMNPCVLWNEEKQVYQMWYSAGECYEPDVICYAESEDGISWEKHPMPVLEKYPHNKWEKAKVGGCHVIREHDGRYHIYYIGYQNIDVARICEAYSDDAITWHRPPHNLVLSPSIGSWDSDATYKPSVICKDDKTFLWYNGRKGTEEHIGLALRICKETNI